MHKRHRQAPIALVVATLPLAAGCFAPAGYRLPEIFPRSIAYERAETAVHDPFPMTDAGPDISARPPSFNQPRPEPRRAEERAGISSLRNQYGTPVAPITPTTREPSYFGAIRE